MPTESAGIVDVMKMLRSQLRVCHSQRQELEYESAARLDALHQSRQREQELLLALEAVADGALAPDAPIINRVLGRST